MREGSITRPLLLGALLAPALGATTIRGGLAAYPPQEAAASAEPDTAAAARPGLDDPEEFGAFVDGVIRTEMEEHHIPGAVFLLVKDGRVFFSRGYGYANLEDRTPVEPERTVFRVGSNSKTLTAAAVLQLVESGRVRLDEDVNTYLTRVEVPATYPTPVTLRHLLTHTAGLDETFFGQHARTPEDWLPLADYLAAHLTPRTSPPGRVVSYNDHGTSLAGLVVEEVSGQPFADYVRERVFEPLGMLHSSFEVVDLPDDIQRNLARAYRFEDGGHFPYDYDYINTPPAAGMVSTASDMGRFLLALLGGGQLGESRILADSSVALMTRRQFGHFPQLPGRAFGFVEHDENGERGWSKDGQATGFTARIFLLPERDIGFFAAQTRSVLGPGPGFNSAAGFHRRLTTAILDRYFMPDSLFFERPEAPAPDPGLDATPFVGTYRNVEGSRHTLEKILFLSGETAVTDNGDGTLSIGFGRWVQLDPGLFQWSGGGPYYRGFRFDETGRATHLLIGAGAEERAPWYETLRFTLVAAGLFTLVFFGTWVAWLVGWWRGRRRERSGAGGRARISGGGLQAAAACLHLLFLAGFGYLFSQADVQDLMKGVPPTIGAVLALPVAAAALTAPLPLLAARAWRRRQGSPAGRWFFSLVTLALLLFLVFLANWRLLGWQY